MTGTSHPSSASMPLPSSILTLRLSRSFAMRQTAVQGFFPFTLRSTACRKRLSLHTSCYDRPAPPSHLSRQSNASHLPPPCTLACSPQAPASAPAEPVHACGERLQYGSKAGAPGLKPPLPRPFHGFTNSDNRISTDFSGRYVETFKRNTHSGDTAESDELTVIKICRRHAHIL